MILVSVSIQRLMPVKPRTGKANLALSFLIILAGSWSAVGQINQNQGKPPARLTAIPKVVQGKDHQPTIKIKNATVPADLLKQIILKLDHDFPRNDPPAELQIQDSVIEGKLNLSGSKLGITCDFERLTFTDDVELANAELQTIMISDSVFAKDASFYSATFANSASFHNVNFKQGALFSDATFSQSAFFVQSIFGAGTNFTSAQFGAIAEFQSTIFQGPLVFELVEVKKSISFRDAKFKSLAYIDNLNTPSGNFAGAIFEDRAYFDESTFSQEAIFFEAIFKGDVSFDECTFPSVVAARDCHGGVIFTGVVFEKRAWLEFRQLVESSSWRPFTNPRLKLHTCSMRTFEVARLFHGLHEVFKTIGDTNGVNNTDYFEQVEETRAQQSNSEKAKGYFSEYLWGYGFRPWRPLFWLMSSIALFAVPYWTQTLELRDKRKHWQWARWRFAGLFSWRAAFKLKPITDEARTATFKAVVLMQWAISKLLLLLFIKALAANTPLIGELVNKLIPI